MNVSFNPAISSNNFKGLQFLKKGKCKNNCLSKPATKDEIYEARTKKVLSYARYIILLIGILYFAVKKSVKDAEDVTAAINKKKVDSMPKPVISGRLA